MAKTTKSIKPTVDVERFDRQIRLFGMEGQQRIATSTVLVYNTGFVGSEFIKNLVLGGIHKCSIYNHTSGIFHHHGALDINRIQKLNPHCQIEIITETKEITEEYDIVAYSDIKDEETVRTIKAQFYVCIEQFGTIGYFKLGTSIEPLSWTINAKEMTAIKLNRKIGISWPVTYALITGSKTVKDVNLKLKKWNITFDKELLKVIIANKEDPEPGLANIIAGFAAQETLNFISNKKAQFGVFSVDGYELKIKKI